MRVKAFVLTLSLTRPIRECTSNAKMPQKMPKIGYRVYFGKWCRHDKNARCSSVSGFTTYTPTSQRFTHPVSLDVGHNISHTKSDSSSATNDHFRSLCDPRDPPTSPRGTDFSLYHPRRFNLLKQSFFVVVVVVVGGWWW